MKCASDFLDRVKICNDWPKVTGIRAGNPESRRVGMARCALRLFDSHLPVHARTAAERRPYLEYGSEFNVYAASTPRKTFFRDARAKKITGAACARAR